MLDNVIKQMIGNTEYGFNMTNKTIRKIDEKYGNYASVIYGIMNGKQFYTNALRLVSVCCVNKESVLIDEEKSIYKEETKEFTVEELENTLTPQQYEDTVGMALDLYLNYRGVNEKKEEDNKGKN